MVDYTCSGTIIDWQQLSGPHRTTAFQTNAHAQGRCLATWALICKGTRRFLQRRAVQARGSALHTADVCTPRTATLAYLA